MRLLANGWFRRLVVAFTLVGLIFVCFAVVAHSYDPRWPPVAVGPVRTAVSLLTWPGTWIGSVLVVTRVNPFPAGWAYVDIWAWSVCGYALLVFVAMTLVSRMKALLSRNVVSRKAPWGRRTSGCS
jgi:hypothetical protein